MADLRERKAESKLMRYCEDSWLYDNAADATCPGCRRRGRVRRVFVCSECEHGFFNMAGFDAHECHDAY